MYLAPLNADRFFKKVFSDEWIAKRFLEDFLDIEIESLELLSNQHRVTDDSAIVEFDFRCKIEGRYVIIDMQQWYKKDIAQRFYLYHTANTVLQLEELSKERKKLTTEEKRKKWWAYDTLLPAITLIWMVHDSLGYQEDYVGFKMLPEGIGDFVRNNELWEDKDEFALLKEKRNELLKLMNNQTKEMDFLEKGRLVYMFQRNIVKNQKMKKYQDWFEFAEKTQQSDNTKQEFKKFETDDVFSEIMRKLHAEKMEDETQEYIKLYNMYVGLSDKLIEEGREEERQRMYQEELERAKEMKQDGLSLTKIRRYTNLPIDVIENL